MFNRYTVTISIITLMGFANSAIAAGDAEAGAKIFRKCKACHTIGEGAKNKTGPILTNVYGKAAGTVEGFKKYSKSMVSAGEKGMVWDDENLKSHLKSPSGNLKTFLRDDTAKSKMGFKLKRPQEIEDVIAFLKVSAQGNTSANMSEAHVADTSEYGNDEDISYAKKLWDYSVANRYAGAERIVTLPYRGHAPHGLLLENFYDKIEINGHVGAYIMKTNYGPEGVTVDQVLSDPDKHLGAYTVMFQREAGYDPDNGDWFWAEYDPSGALIEQPGSKPLAGRVGLCIDCHQAADGDDQMFMSNQVTR